MKHTCENCKKEFTYEEGDFYPVTGHPEVEEFVCYNCLAEQEE